MVYIRRMWLGVVLGFGLACAGVPVPTPAPEPVVVAPAPPAPVETAAARRLTAQKEAGCGYTHRGSDGKIWFVEEIGGGYAIVNVDGKDRMLNPVDLGAADPNPKVERAAYADDGVRIEVARQKKKARVEVTVGGATETVETAVNMNECA